MKKFLLTFLIFSALMLTFTVFAADGKAEYLKGDMDTLKDYIAKAEALTEEIKNSPTNVTYTGTAYYISPFGNDDNDGLTPETAWKSVSKISGALFLKPGDAVLFERGGTYRYVNAIKTVGGVTYSAYGSGAKPRLIGSLNASSESEWKETQYPGVYEYTAEKLPSTRDVGVIVFDNGAAWGVKHQNNTPINVASNGLETIDYGTPVMKNAGELKYDLAFWHDHTSETLYLYSKDGNPAERFSSVEIVDYGHGMSGDGNNVTIDNLDFFGFGSHGIGYSTTHGLTVQYCTFSFIGGSLQAPTVRFGNAVEIFGSGKDFTIHHCYADNVYDCCWTIQYQGDSKGVDMYFENVDFYSNVCYYSNTGLEVWLYNGANDKTLAEFSIKNMRLHDNYTLYNGYGWSQQRPNKNANNFYGATGGGIVYENCSVDNNVGLFTSCNVLLGRYIGSGAYNFNNNVYFQDPDHYMGGVSENPETGSTGTKDFKYDYATMKNLISTGFEKGTKFYYMDGYEVPLYKADKADFADTKEHWAKPYIEKAYIRNYFKGTDANSFSPNMTMTRAMLVTVLSRMADFDVKIKDVPFTDINPNAWYSKAVNWAYMAGLVDEGTTKFRPDEPATREEIADMLYRFTLGQYKTKKLTNPALDFTDKTSVTPGYESGIKFAIDMGIISGYPDGTVKPKETATRAEVATMLCRFADKYVTLEADYGNLSGITDFKIFDGNALTGFTSVFNGERRIVTEDEVSKLKMFAPEKTYSPPALHIFERLSKINFEDYPYVKVRAYTDFGGSTYSIKLNNGENSYELKRPAVKGEWNNEIFSIYDLVPVDKLDTEATNTTIILSPWQGLSESTYPYPKRGENPYIVEYIGFFPSKEAAEAYQSELEKSSVTVTFMAGDNVFVKTTQKTGTGLKYPDETPKKLGYAFAKWDVSSGTSVTKDITVNAVFEKRKGDPVVIFTPENTKATGVFKASVLEENGMKYYHFVPNSNETSKDGTRANVVLEYADYDIAESTVMKIVYRTNIKTSKTFDVNIWLTTVSRLWRKWGVDFNYGAADTWHEYYFDMSKAFGGGENIDTSGGAENIYKLNAKGALASVTLKPYDKNGTAMSVDDYYDVAYIAFYDSEEDAKAHKLLP